MKPIQRYLVIAASVTTACILFGCNRQGTVAPANQAAPTEATPAARDLESSANKLVDLLSKEDFAGVVAMFDATMKAALPEATLKQTWASVVQQAGPFKSRGSVRIAKEQGYDVVYVPCQFERANLNAKVVFGKSGEVAGFFLNNP